MLFKIARQTVKHKWRDLLVLFIGLIIATAIFFMFSTVATNEAFLKTNTSIRNITIIFNVGQFLLGIITFVYLNFANRFLVQLRQREYGLLMMFGANKFAVSRLLFLETTLVGLVSLVFGIIFGTGFTTLAGQVIQNMLGITLNHWQNFNLPGLIVTLIYFVIVFSLNGLVNQFYVGRTSINKLLKADQKSESIPKSGWLQIVTGILGIVILGSSFFALKVALNTGSILIVLLIAVILNVVGTFLILRSSLTFILMLIAGLKSSQKGLRRFVIGQLSFRLQAFQRILTIVTLLFALALGAMTVGIGFKTSTEVTAKNYSPNTINVIQPTTHEKQLISKLSGVVWNHSYQYKVTKDNIVWEANQFKQTPLPYFEKTKTDSSNKTPKINYANVRDLQTKNTKNNAGYIELYDLVTNSFDNFLELDNIINQSKFDQMDKPIATVSVIRVNDMHENSDVLNDILSSQQKRFPMLASMSGGGAYANYVASNSIFGGLEFMGFFLSIAFLVMLASTLMFKILTNVTTDQKRYGILSMLGATKGQRLQANMIEIAVLFAVPLVIGFVDVLYGLQSFKSMLPNPYIGLPISVFIIGGFYILYYLITIILYQRLLANNEK